MHVQLRIIASTKPGSSVFTIGAMQISDRKFLIGRDPECHFRPNSSLVSRHHCLIVKDEFSVRIRDLGSKNGTTVNSQPVHGDVILANEDVIGVGDLILQVFISGDDAPVRVEDDTSLAAEQPQPGSPSAASNQNALVDEGQ